MWGFKYKFDIFDYLRLGTVQEKFLFIATHQIQQKTAYCVSSKGSSPPQCMFGLAITVLQDKQL